VKTGIYARVSTFEQTAENQLQELRRYVQARGWEPVEYVDEGVSGSRESRPALDRLLNDARRRRLDAVVVWRLDRFGRSLRHLILTIDELHALGVAFISLTEGLDATSPAGKLQLHILGAISEFERGRIVERVRAGLARARAQGRRLGRPKAPVPVDRLATVTDLSNADAARALGVSVSTVKRWRRAQKTLLRPDSLSPRIADDSGTAHVT
jgi:putative DNA-invertase from lambdoid prophage Rac